MAERAERPEYNIPFHCGLCRFTLEDGDSMVIGMSTGPPADVGILVYAMPLTAVVGRNGMVISRELSFEPIILEEDVFCVARPSGQGSTHGERAVGCHPGCLKLVPAESRTPFINATSYLYQPAPTEYQRRSRWIRLKWSSILCRTYRLPLELCDHIAQNCLRVFAVLRAFASWESTLVPGPLSFSAKVWARYTLFEGVRYISSLTNDQPAKDDPGFGLVFEPMPNLDGNTIYLAEDHLGVRALLCTSSSKTPTVKERPDYLVAVCCCPRLGPETREPS
jgi:hypothetical protein